MVDFKGLSAKAKQFAQRNPDKIRTVIDRAGDLVDRRTGRKYERHVDTAQQRARDYLGEGRPDGRPVDGTDHPGATGPGTAQPGGPGPAGGTVPPPDGFRGGQAPDQDPGT